jgi:hypothetical protein
MVVERKPNLVTLEELARDVALAWAGGNNDALHAAALGLFLHLYGEAPLPSKTEAREYDHGKTDNHYPGCGCWDGLGI